jgi:hypothetical protein
LNAHATEPLLSSGGQHGMSAPVAIDISIGFAEMAAPPFAGTNATEMAIITASIMRAIGMRSTTIGRWSTGQRRRVWKDRHNAFVTHVSFKAGPSSRDWCSRVHYSQHFAAAGFYNRPRSKNKRSPRKLVTLPFES